MKKIILTIGIIAIAWVFLPMGVAASFTTNQVQGVFGEFKPVLDPAETEYPTDKVKGVLGEIKPVLNIALVSAGQDSWLSGWDKRIRILVNPGYVDSDITQFPLLLTLGSYVGDGRYDVSAVFDELQLDDNRKKIAITRDDGQTQLYVEIEKWDDANEQAWLWVSDDDWVLDADAPIELYLYYDIDHADNTDYVADISLRTEVWESGNVGTWHLGEGTGSTTYDSTSNNNDGTITDATWATSGKIGNALNFDGNDYVSFSDSPSLNPSSKLTIVIWVKQISGTTIETWVSKEGSATNRSYYVRQIYYAPNRQIELVLSADGTNFSSWRSGINFPPIGEWFMLAVVVDTNNSNPSMYINGQLISGSWFSGAMPNSLYDNTAQLTLGVRRLETAPTEYFTGLLDLPMIFNRALTVTEIKALYYSENDNLVSWGSEEQGEAPPEERRIIIIQ